MATEKKFNKCLAIGKTGEEIFRDFASEQGWFVRDVRGKDLTNKYGVNFEVVKPIYDEDDDYDEPNFSRIIGYKVKASNLLDQRIWLEKPQWGKNNETNWYYNDYYADYMVFVFLQRHKIFIVRRDDMRGFFEHNEPNAEANGCVIYDIGRLEGIGEVLDFNTNPELKGIWSKYYGC